MRLGHFEITRHIFPIFYKMSFLELDHFGGDDSFRGAFLVAENFAAAHFATIYFATYTFSRQPIWPPALFAAYYFGHLLIKKFEIMH